MRRYSPRSARWTCSPSRTRAPCSNAPPSWSKGWQARSAGSSRCCSDSGSARIRSADIPRGKEICLRAADAGASSRRRRSLCARGARCRLRVHTWRQRRRAHRLTRRGARRSALRRRHAACALHGAARGGATARTGHARAHRVGARRRGDGPPGRRPRHSALYPRHRRTGDGRVCRTRGAGGVQSGGLAPRQLPRATSWWRSGRTSFSRAPGGNRENVEPGPRPCARPRRAGPRVPSQPLALDLVSVSCRDRSVGGALRGGRAMA